MKNGNFVSIRTNHVNQHLFSITSRVYRIITHLIRTTFLTSIITASTAASHSVFASEDEARVLKLGHVGHGNGAIHAGADRLAKHLKTVSNNKLTIEIHGRAVLGNIPELWVQMQQGSLDLQVIDAPAIAILKPAKRANVLLVPFLFRDQQHMRMYYKSDVFTELSESITTETGIRFVGAVAERSPRVVSTTKRPIRKVEDMQGLRIRVPGLPIFHDVFKAWGAVPVPIRPTEMFTALKSGVVEGEDNGVINLVYGRNAEIIKYFTPINWKRNVVAAWMSDKTWGSLTEQQQQWVTEAAELAANESANLFSSEMQQAYAELDKFGISVNQPDIDGFKSVTDTIIQSYEGKVWPAGEVARIRAVQ